ncbi:hypothetical protein LOTGIDRAFT_114705 [Lottia gigantea]|uniref:Ribosome biogenesis protein BOP1 homolog n=1 Tax=Lottia gigantea TaxID=225164 RepID=V4A357_LOTGI|nr:hypothetical protein LOTGIDRAFT_114705 [Lottia gigantea]ESO98298.1 hypothetical protein LOTGIDRAFT_114705 [Lottia gigantea]
MPSSTSTLPVKKIEKERKITQLPDEYEYDSSDEEDIRNTVGNIPMEWYRDYDHIGYDVEGKKLLKPQKGDQLDEFLDKMENPDYWRTVDNKSTGQKVLLSKEDVNIIQNMQKFKNPTGSNMYEPWVDYFSNEKMIHPISNRPETKASFVPSRWEMLKVSQMVHALKMGWMKPSREKTVQNEEEENKFYMLWKDDQESEITKQYRQYIPAPKVRLPGHAESYNPPEEYLPSEKQKLKKEAARGKPRLIPTKFSSLRLVPAYANYIRDRFERCLDLYLCPRQRKVRMNVNPEDLIPKLPKPRDLQPFPTTESLVFRGHKGIVRCISPDPKGQWIASGSDDKTVKIWEVATGRCIKTFKLDSKVKSIAWNPNPSLSIIVIAIETCLILINPEVGDKLLSSKTDTLISSFEEVEPQPDKPKVSEWNVYEDKEYEEGYRLKIQHQREISHVTWHGKGDYFASTLPKGESKSVLIHQLTKRRSQNPFSKPKGLVQCVLFHPIRPFLFVATQRYVRIYNLMKQSLSKKLVGNCRWISSMAVHPGGDNVIIGSYDSKLSWFDLDLSTKPYHTLRHHTKALRQVTYHKRYPLFASASDDLSVIICHGMVYSDLLQNPLIVPVKILRGHKAAKGLGVLDCQFHPSQPWIFTAGSDSTIRLFT